MTAPMTQVLSPRLLQKKLNEFNSSLKKMQETNGELNKSLQKLTAQNTQANKDLNEAKDKARQL